MLTFALLMQSPPWVYALLLCDDPVAVRETIQFMKRIWEIVLELEKSSDPLLRDLVDELTFLSGPCSANPSSS